MPNEPRTKLSGKDLNELMLRLYKEGIPNAPILEDGKTLDELAPDPISRRVIAAERAEGFSDEEIWEGLKAW